MHICTHTHSHTYCIFWASDYPKFQFAHLYSPEKKPTESILKDELVSKIQKSWHLNAPFSVKWGGENESAKRWPKMDQVTRASVSLCFHQ